MNARLILSLCLALFAITSSGPSSIAAPESARRTTQTWHPWKTATMPRANPVGEHFPLNFNNHRANPVKIFWMSPKGERTYYYEIPPGGTQARQEVRKGAIWFATDGVGKELGYFVIETGIGEAVIPPE